MTPRRYGDVVVAWPEVDGASERDAPAFLELFLHDTFLIRNLSEPGSFEGVFRVGLRDVVFDPRLFVTTRERVPVEDVIAWYDALGIGTRQRAESGVEIALFELLALSRREEDELESVLRLARAAAGLELTLPRLEELRSKIDDMPVFHPMHDDALDPSVEDALADWIAVLDDAAKAVVEDLQRRARR